MNYSNLLRKKADPIWVKIFNHPFLIEMSKGTLPIEKFKFFTTQDYTFLIDFSKALGVAASKIDDVEDFREFITFLHSTITVEMDSLKDLANKLGILPENLSQIEPSPANFAYTRHILVTAHMGSFGEFISSIMPCMWSYQEIGEKIGELQGLLEHPIYSGWASTYYGKEYKNLVKWLRAILDKSAAKASRTELAMMEKGFIISSKYEYMFWDMAYRLQKWAV
jgi:thiaminase/transcriptional activator TenA